MGSYLPQGALGEPAEEAKTGKARTSGGEGARM
jgi:hypothetical protein